MSEAPTSSAEAMLSRLETSLNTPLRAMLEISDRCNEVCVHCYQVQGQKGEMSTEQLKRLLDDLARMGVLLLTVSGGEPTLRKDFLEILEYAKDLGFIVRLFTNGLTMTPELAKSLRQLSVMEVEISLYSPRADVHDFVTGVSRSFERTVRAIELLVENGLSVCAKTPVMSVNENDISQYIAFVNGLGATHRFDIEGLLPEEGGNRAPEAWNPSHQAALAIQREHGAAPTGLAPRPRAATDMLCGAGEGLHIEANGEIRPCTMLSLNLGSALDEGVARAHHGNENAASLRVLRWEHVHGCRDCDLGVYCGRCYASALAEVGDALAPYPTACARARRRYEHALGAAPQIAASGDRDPNLGPYRQLAPGLFEPFADTVTLEDDARAARFAWLRQASGGSASPDLAVTPGKLVQIRRPGRKTLKLERVPGEEQKGGVVSARDASGASRGPALTGPGSSRGPALTGLGSSEELV